ncbi:MAG: SWIM zinc finger family protein, partial [Rhabdochlamydiaceae bacterium]
MQSLEIRAQKGKEISENFGAVTRCDETTYKVKSQSSNTIYEIVSTERGWTCQCPDQRFRGVKCKHIWGVEFSFALREEVRRQTAIVISPLSTTACIFCNSEQIIKKAVRHNKTYDVQRHLCKNCGKRFSFNVGFEGMRASPKVITSALQLYFQGESLRKIQNFLSLQGVKISYVGVYKWIKRYIALMEKHLDNITPNVG